ncbi:MAG: hypothetical protein LBU82_04405 [Treponema sp.]|jgi:hypothetical protein|nr:hypothetical protein [Treponema sp.]
MGRRFLSGFFFLSISILLSCAKAEPVQFPVKAAGEVLLGQTREAREGALDLSRSKKLDYRFDDAFKVPPDSSLEIAYSFSAPLSPALKEKYPLVLNMDAASWELPSDLSFLQIEGGDAIRYSIPVDNAFSGRFSISLKPDDKPGKDAPVFRIESVELRERWFGFYKAGGCVYTSPFVYRREDGAFQIDAPDSFRLGQRPEITVALFSGKAALEIVGRKVETAAGANAVHIPPMMFPSSGQAAVSGEGIGSFMMTFPAQPLFPEPITADPALVLEWLEGNWRNKDYEVFRWERFPSLLIFDTANYDVQDRLMKRLAFFVEKAGFRGRLAKDAEIAGLHGWNANDYRAEDLARFFETARKADFPLLKEEMELKSILLNEGIIIEKDGGIAPGSGGIISISRESSEYLRYRFMVHEGFHGIFFIDEDFRAFSRRRWESLPVAAKRFIISFFDYQQYDTKDEYLLINEFMAHVMQQNASESGDYFGRYLPLRLETSWRRASLPEKNEESGTWPALASAFAKEAQAFSAYINSRWGLAAGRVWYLIIK